MLYRHEFHAMGCEMLAVVEKNTTPIRLAQVPTWFEEWEQTLSRFRIDSELTRLNQVHAQPVQVSETLWQVFQAAQKAEQLTAGLVTPTLLEALLEAGYDRPFDSLPPDQNLPLRPGFIRTASPTLTALSVDDSTRTLTLPPGVGLDFGGVAKGWAAHQAMQRLQAEGPALVDAGGDIAISGPRQGGESWEIGVARPFQPDQEIEILHLPEGGVATSGKDRRRWSQNGIQQHHIIDPFTGRPAETDLLTVTVVAPDVLQAEAAAKAALILGAQTGLEWIESHPAFASLFFLENGRIIHSQKLKGYL